MRAFLDFINDVLQAVLELALDANPRLQQAHVERMNFSAQQDGGHVLVRDAQRQPFDDGGLADARLAGQDRVVLAPPHQDIDRLPDFHVASDHRVDLALSGTGGQVGRELVECRGPGASLNGQRADRVTALARIGCRNRVDLRFLRPCGQGGNTMLQVIRVEFAKQRRTALRQLGQLRLGQQRLQQVRAADRADALGPDVERGDQPGLFEQFR
jgi:hypothetical protein